MPIPLASKMRTPNDALSNDPQNPGVSQSTKQKVSSGDEAGKARNKAGKTAFVPAQAPHVRPTVQRTLLRNLRFSTFGSPSRPVVLCRNADFLPRGFVHNL